MSDIIVKLVSKGVRKIAEALDCPTETIKFADIILRDSAEYALLKAWREKERATNAERVKHFIKITPDT